MSTTIFYAIAKMLQASFVFFEVIQNIFNYSCIVLGFVGLFYWLNYQKKFNDELWDSTKSKYCKEHNISLHIDDTSIYNNYFTTPFCRLWSHSNQPKSPHKDVRHLE